MDVHQIPADDTAKSLAELTGFKGKDGIAAVLALPRGRSDDGGSFFFATERGMVKRVSIGDVQANTAGDFPVFNVEDGDRLGWALHTNGKQEVILVTAEGQSIRFGEDDVRVMGLPAGGVGGIKLRGKDRVVYAAVAEPEGELVTISGTGFAKRTLLAEYSSQGRNGGGILAHKLVERTGKLTAALVLPQGADQDPVILVTGKGAAKTLAVADIPRMGRAASGKQVLTLAERDAVVAAWHMVQGGEGGPEGGKANEGAGDGAEAVVAPAASPAVAPARKTAARASVVVEQAELLAEPASAPAAVPARERGGKTPASTAPLPLKQVDGAAKKKTVAAAESAKQPAPAAEADRKPVGATKTVDKTTAKAELPAAPVRKEKPSARPTPAQIAAGTRGPKASSKEPPAPRFDFGEEDKQAPKPADQPKRPDKTVPRKLETVVSVTKSQAGQSKQNKK